MTDGSVGLDFLVIGAITADIGLDGVKRPGGSALYSAITAARLGYRAAIVSRPRDDMSLGPLLQGIKASWTQPASAISFRNIYQAGQRVQYFETRERGVQPLGHGDIPREWAAVPMVHIAPVAHDVDPSLAPLFPNSIVLATPQGWLRTWDTTGRIMFLPRRWDQETLKNIDIVVLSEEDIDGDQAELDQFTEYVPIVVLTRGDKGCEVAAGGPWRHVAPFPSRVVDPTGAGDTFAAAFLIHYYYNRSPEEAAIFASCVASLAIEGVGTEAIPSLDAVKQRLWEHGYAKLLPEMSLPRK